MQRLTLQRTLPITHSFRSKLTLVWMYGIKYGRKFKYGMEYKMGDLSMEEDCQYEV